MMKMEGKSMIIESVYIFNGVGMLTIFDSYIASLDGIASNRTIYKDILCKTDMINYLLDKTLIDDFGMNLIAHYVPTTTSIQGLASNVIVDRILKNTNIPNWLICKNIADIVTNILKDNFAESYTLRLETTMSNNNVHVAMYVEIPN